jgi:hypothetical protein
MQGIYAPNDSFIFDKISLLSPVNQSGNYFIRFRVNDNPLYIQPPKCKTKQGIFKSGKKIYCDLLYTNENEQYIRWVENLELYCRKIMFENREKWFETNLDENDIETYFTSPFKVVKSGKFYLTRVNVPSILGNCSLKAYNEDENEIDIESIKENMEVMTVLEVQGIKCSARNFQIEMEIKQIMLLNDRNLFEKCIFHMKETSNIANIVETANENYKAPLVYNKIKDLEEKVNEIKEDFSQEQEYDLSKSDNLDAETVNIETPVLETKEPDILPIQNTPEVEINNDGVIEVEFDLDKLNSSEFVEIKEQKDIYYEMYVEAKRKAKIARDLAISSYLEAKRIKNIYMIQDTDSDLDEEKFIKSMDEESRI